MHDGEEFPPTGEPIPLRLRSLVGLIPLLAVEVLDANTSKNALDRPDLAQRMKWYAQFRPQLTGLVSRWGEPGAGDARLFAISRIFRMTRVLARMLDDTEFLSPCGLRSISRVYRDQPYVFDCGNFRGEVRYTPAESDIGLGAVIPLLYGKGRMASNVIWMRGFDEEVRTETQTVGGGKGGGGGSTTVTNVTYHYYADVAVGLCAGPIAGVNRVFADGNAFEDDKVSDMRFISGTSHKHLTLMQAVEGVDRTGTCQ